MSVEPWSGVSSAGPSGVWGAARVHSLVRNWRDPSVGALRRARDQGYRPMVKTTGAQRESEGGVVPLIGVRNAPGGKGPCFDHAHVVGKCEGMTGSARPNSPGEPLLAVADDGPLCASRVKVRALQHGLWAVAKQSEGWRFHALFDRDGGIPRRRCDGPTTPSEVNRWFATLCDYAAMVRDGGAGSPIRLRVGAAMWSSASRVDRPP